MNPDFNKDAGVFGVMVNNGYNNNTYLDSNLLSQETDWQTEGQEGELAVDVIETKHNIIVISTIAGAKAETIEVHAQNDLLTIKGYRERPIEELTQGELHLEECFWGSFSRTIVLPVDVQSHRAEAEYKNGVLKVVIPKQMTSAKIPVIVVDE